MINRGGRIWEFCEAMDVLYILGQAQISIAWREDRLLSNSPDFLIVDLHGPWPVYLPSLSIEWEGGPSRYIGTYSNEPRCIEGFSSYDPGVCASANFSFQRMFQSFQAPLPSMYLPQKTSTYQAFHIHRRRQGNSKSTILRRRTGCCRKGSKLSFMHYITWIQRVSNVSLSFVPLIRCSGFINSYWWLQYIYRNRKRWRRKLRGWLGCWRHASQQTQAKWQNPARTAFGSKYKIEIRMLAILSGWIIWTTRSKACFGPGKVSLCCWVSSQDRINHNEQQAQKIGLDCSYAAESGQERPVPGVCEHHICC